MGRRLLHGQSRGGTRPSGSCPTGCRSRCGIHPAAHRDPAAEARLERARRVRPAVDAGGPVHCKLGNVGACVDRIDAVGWCQELSPPVAPVVGGVVSNTFPRLCGDVSGGIQYLDVRALWGASRMQRRITKEDPHVRCLTVAVGTTNRAKTSRPRSPRWLTRSSPRLHAMYSTDLTPAPCLLRRRCSVGTTAIPHGAPLGTS